MNEPLKVGMLKQESFDYTDDYVRLEYDPGGNSNILMHINFARALKRDLTIFFDKYDALKVSDMQQEPTVNHVQGDDVGA